MTKAVSAPLLVALATVPLFFDPATETVFEPPKVALLRALMVVAIVGVAVDPSARQRVGRLVRSPIGLAATAVLTVSLLSTATSIAPARSLLGSFARSQGLLTDIALYVAFLAAGLTAWTEVRPGSSTAAPAGDHTRLSAGPAMWWPRRLPRLSAVLAGGTLPVALYAAAQAAPFALDPLPWSGDVTTRVAGPMGNSVMLAAYLATAYPFVVLEWLRSVRGRGTRERGSMLDLARRTTWSAALILTPAALLLSGSRGPLLALGGGAVMALLAFAATHRRRGLAVFVATGCLVGLASLAALARFGSGPLQSLPAVERMTHAFDPDRDTTRVRLRLWEGSLDAVRASPERLLLGSGPETMELVWAPHFPSILAYDEPRGYTPDRAHSLVYDLLITKGALGLAAQLLAFLAVGYVAVGSLGAGCAARALSVGSRVPLRSESTAGWRFIRAIGIWRPWLFLAVGGASFALLPFALRSQACIAQPYRAETVDRLGGAACLMPPLIALGLLAGTAAWLIAAAASPHPAGNLSPAASETNLVAPASIGLAVLAVTVVHYLETLVAFPVVASQLVFWAAAGGLAGVTTSHVTRQRGSRAAVELRPDFALPPLSATAAGAPGPAALQPATLLALAAGATLLYAFARPGLVSGGGTVAVVLVVLSTLAVWLALTSNGSPPRHSEESDLPASELILLLIGLLVLAALQILALRAGTRAPADAVTGVTLHQAVYLGALLLIVGGLVLPRRPGLERSPEPMHIAAGILAVCAALALFASPLTAEALVKEAQAAWMPLGREQRLEGESGLAEVHFKQAMERVRKARRLAPWQPELLLVEARMETERADLIAERLDRAHALGETLPAERAAERDAAFERALGLSARAAELAPGWPDPWTTGARSARVWAERLAGEGAFPDAAPSVAGDSDADADAGSSPTTAPEGVSALRDPSELRDASLRRARDAYGAAISRAPKWPQLLDEAAWVELLAADYDAALQLTSAALELDRFYRPAHRTAAAAWMAKADYSEAAAAYQAYFEDPRNAADIGAHRGLLRALTLAGDLSGAVQAAHEVVRLAPADAHARADLAALLEEQGDYASALEQAQLAAQLAPGDPGIREMLTGLQNRTR